jgi:hypothetical protein
MTQRKVVFAGIVFVLLFLLLTVKTLAAAEQTCVLSKEKFDELKSIQNNPAFDYAQEIKAELDLRKNLLRETVGCAVKDAENIKSSLDSAAVSDADTKKLKDELSGKLGDAINYYELQRLKIDDLGLQGSRDFSRSLKDWRDGNYTTVAELASNLIIWSRNQDIIKTTQNRINQINQTVYVLKLVDNEEIQNLWEEASANFKKALDFNGQAGESLRRFDSPDKSLEEIKSSLDALADTYKKFFELSDVISKMLPG